MRVGAGCVRGGGARRVKSRTRAHMRTSGKIWPASVRTNQYACRTRLPPLPRRRRPQAPPASHMNLARRLLQSLRLAKCSALQAIPLAAHAASQG